VENPELLISKSPVLGQKAYYKISLSIQITLRFNSINMEATGALYSFSHITDTENIGCSDILLT